MNLVTDSKPSNIRDFYNRVAQLRQEPAANSEVNFHNIVRLSLHTLRALLHDNRNSIELMDAQIVALERLQSYINDIHRLMNNQDRNAAMRAISDHQGAISDEMIKASVRQKKCDGQIAQCEKELPEHVQTWENKRVRKIAKRLLLKEAIKSLSADREKSGHLQAALFSYEREIAHLDKQMASYNSLCYRVIDPLKQGTLLSTLRLARELKCGFESHVDFLSRRFEVFVKLTEQVQAGRWGEASESFVAISVNHSEALVMVRKIKQVAQEDLQKHENTMQIAQKADELYKIVWERNTMPDNEDTFRTEWVPHWDAIESAYRNYIKSSNP